MASARSRGLNLGWSLAWPRREKRLSNDQLLRPRQRRAYCDEVGFFREQPRPPLAKYVCLLTHWFGLGESSKEVFAFSKNAEEGALILFPILEPKQISRSAHSTNTLGCLIQVPQQAPSKWQIQPPMLYSDGKVAWRAQATRQDKPGSRWISHRPRAGLPESWPTGLAGSSTLARLAGMVARPGGQVFPGRARPRIQDPARCADLARPEHAC